MNQLESPSEISLQGRLAEAGPGYRGRRRRLDLHERDGLAFELQAAGVPVPEFVKSNAGWVDRRAKLFEAGDYPDKGVSISPETLRALAENFDLPVPVLIEHSESPLELGYLTDVEAVGHELFGTLALTEEANALVERSQARSLSVGLTPDLSAIREVSLVRAPRVADAQLFWCELSNSTREPHFGVGALETGDAEIARLKTRIAELEAQRVAEQAQRTLDELLAQGRLTPAQLPFARAMIAVNDSVNFDGESQPLAQLLIAMIERQPAAGLFREWVPERENPASAALLLPEEAAFYQTHFPEVSLDAIADAKRA